MSAPDPGPEHGHTFRISISSRGSYSVRGEPGHHDSENWGEPMVQEVRAWSLAEALAKAQEIPFAAWAEQLIVDPPLVPRPEDGVWLPREQADALREFFEATGEHHGKEQREKAAETLGVDGE